MTGLHERLKTLDEEGTAYTLDYVTMKSGFVYRNANVLRHSPDAVFITQERYPETYLKMTEIASARIDQH